jgi:hypothetical protein
METMESKEEDMLAGAASTKGEDADPEDEEDYEIRFGSQNITLRRTAAYAIE